MISGYPYFRKPHIIYIYTIYGAGRCTAERYPFSERPCRTINQSSIFWLWHFGYQIRSPFWSGNSILVHLHSVVPHKNYFITPMNLGLIRGLSLIIVNGDYKPTNWGAPPCIFCTLSPMTPHLRLHARYKRGCPWSRQVFQWPESGRPRSRNIWRSWFRSGPVGPEMARNRGFLKCFGTPIAGWFIMENPTKYGWFGGTHIPGNHQTSGAESGTVPHRRSHWSRCFLSPTRLAKNMWYLKWPLNKHNQGELIYKGCRVLSWRPGICFYVSVGSLIKWTEGCAKRSVWQMWSPLLHICSFHML